MELLLRRRAIMQKTAGGAPVITSVDLPFIKKYTIINMSTGAASENASWYATDYIELPSGLASVSYTNEANATVNFRGAFYDENKGYLSSGLTSIWAISVGSTDSKNVPSNAKFIRLSTNKTSLFNTTQSLTLNY